MSQKKLKHADEIWQRVVTIVQEAMIMGVDCVDLLRMVEVQIEPDSGMLVLTPEYVASVEAMHEKWLEEVARIKSQQFTETVLDPKTSN